MKKILLGVLGMILVMGISVLGYAKEAKNDLSSNIIRLHIIANSDLDYDQELKLKVRDRVIEEMQKYEFEDDMTKSEEFIKNNLLLFEGIAKEVIEKAGYDYNICAEFGNSEFPIKKYGSIVLPAGEYEALRITIGEGCGRNWWCVIFPPLCVTDGTKMDFSEQSKEILKEKLSNETFELINDTGNIEFDMRFKILELLGFTARP